MKFKCWAADGTAMALLLVGKNLMSFQFVFIFENFQSSNLRNIAMIYLILEIHHQ